MGVAVGMGIVNANGYRNEYREWDWHGHGQFRLAARVHLSVVLRAREGGAGAFRICSAIAPARSSFNAMKRVKESGGGFFA